MSSSTLYYVKYKGVTNGTKGTKKCRLYRTNSLAQVLRRKDIPFDFFNLNCIHLTLAHSAFERVEIFISSNPDYYTVRFDFFKWSTWGDFKIFQYSETNGFDLLRVLVASGVLPVCFSPFDNQLKTRLPYAD